MASAIALAAIARMTTRSTTLPNSSPQLLLLLLAAGVPATQCGEARIQAEVAQI